MLRRPGLLQRSPHAWPCVLALALLIGCGDDGGPEPDAGLPDAGPADGGFDASPDAGGPPPMIITTAGPVIGRRASGYLEFLGIPYAAPPVGDLRWRPPQAPEAWTEPRMATTNPNRCPQEALGLTLSGDEDCLYVNVHTPDPMPDAAPVMVWVHGGGFTFGEGIQTDGGTKGDRLALEHGVVVVSMNYRLGALGFLAHPALTAEDAAGASGNYGLLDQVAALHWVQDNIAAFGGDPSNVTLFGESAGGMSVCDHLVSPLSTGLFQRAVVESGPCGRRFWTLAEAEAQGDRFAAALGCDGDPDVLACMRAATVEDVLATLPPPAEFVPTSGDEGQYGSIVDGRMIPDQPMALATAGDVADVPVLFGWNADEGTLFVDLMTDELVTADQYPMLIEMLAGGPGPTADAILAQYPLSAYESPTMAISAALGDFGLACPARRFLQALAPHVTAYAYYFTYPDAQFQLPTTFDLGAFHSGEVQYIFGHPASIGRSSFMGDDLALHEAMSAIWVRLATTGDPGGDGLTWPAYDVAGDRHVVLDRTIAEGAGASADACAFWETLGLYD